MRSIRRFSIVLLAAIIMISGLGFSFQPAQAASCTYVHYVHRGESLSWIGRYYGVNWLYLAQINNIKRPYTIYPGQRLCIAYGTPVSMAWNYSVIGVVKDTSVTIRTSNFPDNVKFEAFIGRLSGGSYEWKKVADLDSDRGGSFKQVFDIPAEFAGTRQLLIRLTQTKKAISVDRWFSNILYNSGTGGLDGGWYYGGIPTIWIVSVVRNTSVTIRTNNFPAGVNFDVLMGPMGTRGIGGYYVSTFNSGAGGSMVLTFNIPAALAGSNRIAIRTQNLATRYYSYNWFWNNTAN